MRSPESVPPEQQVLTRLRPGRTPCQRGSFGRAEFKDVGRVAAQIYDVLAPGEPDTMYTVPTVHPNSVPNSVPRHSPCQRCGRLQEKLRFYPTSVGAECVPRHVRTRLRRTVGTGYAVNTVPTVRSRKDPGENLRFRKDPASAMSHRWHGVRRVRAQPKCGSLGTKF